MKIIKNIPFTVIPNEVFKYKVSLKAVGLYAYIASKPDGWDFSIEGTATQVKDGRDGIRVAVKELEEIGLLERKQERNSDGKMGDGIWIINYTVSEKPTTEKPTSVNPTSVSTTQVNTKVVKTNKVNTKVVSTYSTPTSLTAEDFTEIATKYRVREDFVRNTYEKLTNWCLSKGKRYKNYKAALMNWLRSEIDKNPNLVIRVVNTAHTDIPELTEEQRLANLQRLQEMRSKLFGPSAN